MAETYFFNVRFNFIRSRNIKTFRITYYQQLNGSITRLPARRGANTKRKVIAESLFNVIVLSCKFCYFLRD